MLLGSTTAFLLHSEMKVAGIYDIQFPRTLLSYSAKEQDLIGFIIMGIPWTLTFTTFLIYAISKESQGTMSTSYTMIPLALVSTMGCFFCISAYISTILSHNSDDIFALFIGMFAYLYAIWMFGFIATKSEFYLDVNWVVALVPFWIIIGVLIIPYFASGIALLTNQGDQESKRIFLLVSLLLVPGFLCAMTWFILLSKNLDANDRDEPMIPWIFVHLPIVGTELACIIGFGILCQLMLQNPL